MTYLSLFGSVGTEHGLDQNDAPQHRHHAHNASHDLFVQDSNGFLSHVLSHPHHSPLSLQDHPTSAVSHERTTANHFNHTFFNTSSSAPTTAKPASGLHIPTKPKPHGSPASSSSGTGSSKRKYTASPPEDLDPDSEEAQVAIKRQRNTMAARKYRQKRLDRISDLETALGEVTNERDELKLQLARREAEVEALREMLSKK
uniref:BZIP domain-containing protein n=1 Tax=Photinus pyralis TaxID=7054 RepID=A0A1Y1ND26_PHOPY